VEKTDIASVGHTMRTQIGMDCTSRLTLTDPQGNDKLCSFIPSLKIYT